MKKIMFNDKFGLTQAVLDGKKTMTRRVIRGKRADFRFKCGETVAIAISYSQLAQMGFDEQDWFDSAGYNNKMFVKAEMMPFRIKIKTSWVEWLADITEDECIKEGVKQRDGLFYVDNVVERSNKIRLFNNAYEAFATLIDKVCGAGTFVTNPLVEVYEFRLVTF